MKQNKKINVPLLKDAEGEMMYAVVSFNYISYSGFNSEKILIVDSCSTDNMLSEAFVQEENLYVEEDKVEVVTVGDKVSKMQRCSFSFTLGDNVFNECFHVGPAAVFSEDIVGIVGINFLRKYKLCIDFQTGLLHTSLFDHSNLCFNDCSYFMPMEPGLIRYNLPLIPIKGNGKDLFAMVDTGSNGNILARPAIRKYKIACHHTKQMQEITSVSGTEEVNISCLILELIHLGNSVKECTNEIVMDMFQVVCEDWLLTAKNPKEDEPIYISFGAPFIAKQGWCLDFKNLLIYKRR